jgi:hypothetical protein
MLSLSSFPLIEAINFSKYQGEERRGVGIHITLSNQAENEELVRAKGRQTNRLPLIPLLLILLLSFRPVANYFT